MVKNITMKSNGFDAQALSIAGYERSFGLVDFDGGEDLFGRGAVAFIVGRPPSEKAIVQGLYVSRNAKLDGHGARQVIEAVDRLPTT